MDSTLIFTKVATMYALCDRYVVTKLSKEHAKKLIDLVVNTDMGTVLLQIAKKLYGDEWDSGFQITTRANTGEMVVLMYVSSFEKMIPYLDVLKSIETALAQQGIKLEVDTIDNAAKQRTEEF